MITPLLNPAQAEAHAHLRVIDGDGQVLDTCPACESKDAQLAQLRDDLQNIEQGELRRLRAQVSKLTGDRHKKLKASPAAKDGATVYAYYREKLQPRARAECPPDRMELILSRLNAFTVEELCSAVDGAVVDAFVDEKGKRHDSLELIFRNTGKVYDFIGRAARAAGSEQTETQPVAPTVAGSARSDRQTGGSATPTLFAREAVVGPGDARAAFAELGVRLSAGGRNVAVGCFASPASHRHDDRDKSCSVNVETGAWRCWGCGAAGGVYHAAVALGRRPRGAMELLERHGLVAKREVGVRAPAPSDARERDVAAARERLAASGQVLDRLEVLRGWSPQAVLSLGLGIAGDRLVFGVRDGSGRLVGVNRFAPNPVSRRGPKMIADRGSVRELFPAPETLAGGVVWLVEGEPDAVAARTLSLSACGVPGVQGWRAGWARRFEGRRVVVCMDADPAGREASGRIVADLVAGGVAAGAVDLAPNSDSGYDLGDVVAETTRSPGGRRATARFLDRLAGLSEAAA